MRNAKNMALCGVFTALIAIGAFIRIPVPVVPFTLQYLFTMLAGLLLGAKLGAAAVALYVGMGLIGFPIFTQGGGFGYVFNPSFGYLVGFIVGAYATGKIAHTEEPPRFGRLLAANLIGLFIVYAFGMVHCYLIHNLYMSDPMGVWTLFLYCFVLAVPGDIVLCFVAAAVAKRVMPRMEVWFSAQRTPQKVRSPQR